jgi:hypothetical protein
VEVLYALKQVDEDSPQLGSGASSSNSTASQLMSVRFGRRVDVTTFGLQGRGRAAFAGANEKGSSSDTEQSNEEDSMLFGRITLKSCLKAVRAVE